jgi:hypothetical protein
MNERTGAGDEPTLTDVEREFPGWECWRGTSGLYYARLAGRPRRHKADAQGEDPRDLRDQIIRARSINDYSKAEGGGALRSCPPGRQLPP